MTKYSIIIPHYNTPKSLEKLLVQLTESDVEDIVVIDQASDKFITNFDKKFPKVKLIRNKYNTGFARACNAGVVSVSVEPACRQGRCKWLLFLNPDVEIDHDYIVKLLHYCEDKKLDACSPLPSDKNYRKPVPSFLSLLTEFTPLNKIIPNFIFGKKTLVGGTLLIKSGVLQDLGGWDERFFLWYEDSDLSKRLIDGDYKYDFYNEPVKHVGGESFSSLSRQYKRDIFFNSLETYAGKYFSDYACLPARQGLRIMKFITERFRSTKILPVVNKGLVSMVVPNVKRKLLDEFLENNFAFFKDDQELIIVTSAILPSEVWKYRQKYPGVRFIVLEENKGFADTVNVGFRAASGEWVGTVNDDVILSNDWLTNLIKSFGKKIGGVNPIIVDGDGVIETVGIEVESKGKAIPMVDPALREGLGDQVVDALNGACVVYSKDALNDVGIFDERFGSYLEDIDLSLRMKRKGWKSLINQSINITHLKHQTSQDNLIYKRWLDVKNWWLVLLKNWSLKDWATNFPQIILERLRNLWGLKKAMIHDSKFMIRLALTGLVLSTFIFLRFYKIDQTLNFFGDLGRDFLVLSEWKNSLKPPLLGPQTSAISFNQSAIYFYMLFPIFILSGQSPLSTLYTAATLYIVVFLIGLKLFGKSKSGLTKLILFFLLISINPQFILQHRYVWNPSLITPFLLLSFYSLTKFATNKNKYIWWFALGLSVAVSLSYSLIPTVAVMGLYGLFASRKRLKLLVASITTLLLTNLPTLLFELRHGFLLTKTTLAGQELLQTQDSWSSKLYDLFRYSFPAHHIYLSIFIGVLSVFLIGYTLLLNFKNKKLLATSRWLLASFIIWTLSFVIILISPLKAHAHYLFGVYTFWLLSIVYLPNKYRLLMIGVLIISWLNPLVTRQYFVPAKINLDDKISCVQQLCEKYPQPVYATLHSSSHNHEAAAYKFLMQKYGCSSVPSIVYEPQASNTIAIFAQEIPYDHGETNFFEISQFGEAQLDEIIKCSNNLAVYVLER